MKGEAKDKHLSWRKGYRRLLSLFLAMVMILTYTLTGAGSIRVRAEGEDQKINLGVSEVQFSTSSLTQEQADALTAENPDLILTQADITEVLDDGTQTATTVYFEDSASIAGVQIPDGYALTQDPTGTEIPTGQVTSIQIGVRTLQYFQISFDGNGGEGTMDPLSVREDGQAVIPDNGFTKEGFEFVNFNTDPSGNGTAYNPGDSFQPGENLTLYAQYKEIPKPAEQPEAEEEKQPTEDLQEEDGKQPEDNLQEEATEEQAEETTASEPEISPNSILDPEQPQGEQETYYEIRFMDENGELIPVNSQAEGDAQYVQYVAAGGNTQPPHRPVINDDNHKFVGWFSEPEGQGTQATDESFTNISADATWYAYYTSQTTYTIKIEYVYGNDGKEAAEPYVVQVSEGSSYTATVESPELAGYTADQETVQINESNIQADKTFTVKYSGEMQTYTVEHQWESLENPGTYVTHETETKQGYIGQYTEAQAKTYEGFTAGNYQNILITPTTTADNVSIKIQYTRNNYQLTFDTGENGSYIPAKSVRYGTSLQESLASVGKPTRLGYTFEGWTLEDGQTEIGDTTMPARDYTLQAKWEANTRAGYTVIYWLESLEGGYDYVTQKTGTGNVGDVIQAGNLSARDWTNVNIEDPDGVERDTDKDETVTITADGKAVKNVYYNRKTFMIQFYTKQRTGGWGGTKWVEDEDLRITAKYGAYIADQWNDRAHAAYEWNTEPNGSTSYTLLANMDAKNIKVYQADKGTGTTITYYIEGLNGQREVYQQLTAASGVHLTKEDQTPIDGFTFDDWRDTNKPLWLYYTRNSYTISFENCTGVNDATLKYEARLSNAKPNDSNIKPPAGVDADYVFAGWYTSPACEDGTEVNWNSTMPSHNLQLYAKWEAPEYTIRFESNGAGDIPSITVTKYESIENRIPTPTKEGDTFLGWYLDEDCTEPFIHNTQITEDITLYAKWKNAYTYSYTIQYVDEANQPIEGVDATTGTAEANTYILVEPKEIEGYTATTGSFTTLLDENKKVINVTYKKDATWSFRIRYVDANTRKDIIDPVTQEVPENTSQIIVNSPSVKDSDYAEAFNGYTIVSDPQVTVTKEAATAGEEGEVYTITFEYIQQQQTYVVYHQLQMPDGTYVTVETESKEGQVGQYVTAEPKIYEGYTCISTTLERSGVVTENPNAADPNSGLNIYIKYDRADSLTIQDYIGKYDGQAHGLTVTGKPSDTEIVKETIQYSINGQAWSETPITRTDVSTDADGRYTVYTRIKTEVTVGGKTETYTSQPETHYITIQKRDVTLTAPDATKIYDGTPLNTWYNTNAYQPAVVSGDGFVGEEGFNYYVYTAESSIYTGTGKNVIDQSATLTQLKDNTKSTNYNFTFAEGTLTVTDRPEDQRYVLTITPNSATVTYNGKEQTAKGIRNTVFATNEGENLTGYTVEGVTFQASGTDVATYPVQQTGSVVIKDAQGNDVTNQFTVKVEQANLVINKLPVTITAASESWDYDGEVHSLNESSVTSGKLAEGHDYTAIVTGSVQEQNETADNVISNVVIYDADKNDVTANYEITLENGRLRINAIDAEITAKIQIASKTTEYNGAEQKFTDLEGDDFTVTFEGADGLDTTGWTISGTEITTGRTDAGTTNVYFAEPDNLKVLDKEGNPVNTAKVNVTFGTLTVTKAPLILTADSAEKEYDGTPLTKDSYQVTGLKGEDKITAIQITGSQLAPGSSKNAIEKNSIAIQNASGTSANQNYEITIKDGTLTVTNSEKENRVITVTANSGEKTYDGKPLTNPTFQVTGETLNGLVDRSQVKIQGSQTLAGSGKNVVDADSVHVMNSGVDVTEAYTIKTVDGNLEVTKRPITLTGDSAQKVYDGTALTASAVSQEGTLAETDTFEEQPQATGSQTEVGTSVNPVGTVKIIDKQTNEDRTENYKITKIPGRLEVTKAAADQNKVAIGSETLIYDGKAHSLDPASSAVTEGTTIYYTTKQNPSDSDWNQEMPEFTNVGTHTVYVKAVNPNYNDAYATGVLTIQKRQVTITGKDDTFTYNGQIQTVEGYTVNKAAEGSNTGLLKDHQISGVTAKASSENVGTRIPGTITASADVKITEDGQDVTANYDIITIPGWITIQPLELKVSSESGEQLYNGRALRVREAAITDGELAEGDEISYNFTGMQTEIGSSQNLFTAIISSGEMTVTNNYSIQYTYGTLTVYGEINYQANGGTGDAPKADRYDQGDRYTVKENMFERPGYTFTGWNSRANGQGTTYNPGSTISTLSSNLTLYAQWSAKADTEYKVETYLEGEDGTYPEKPDTTVTRTAQTDTEVSVTEADKTAPEGYALDTAADNVFEGTVAGDGSLVLKLYFAKDEKGGGDEGEDPDDIPDRYQIVFRYVAEANGTVTGTTAEVHTFKDEEGNYTLPEPLTPDGKVEAKADPGYHITGWIDEEKEDLGTGTAPDFGEKTYDTDQTFTVSFDENEKVTIRYEAEAHGKVSRDSETLAPATGEAEGSVATPDTGYHFAGWYHGEDLVSQDLNFIPSRNSEGIYEEATYTAKFAADEQTEYTVEFYYADEDGVYSEEATDKAVRNAETDTTVAVTEEDKQPKEEGYILDTGAENIFEGTVAGDGSLVLKVYFAKDVKGGGDKGDEPDNIPDRYQIVFNYVAKENGSVSGTISETHTFRDEEGNYTLPTPVVPTAEVQAAANAGYHIEGWTDETKENLGAEAAPVFGDRTYGTDQTFTVSFAENADITIRYEAEAHGDVSRDSETLAPATGEAKGSVATPDAGYHFIGWYLGEEKVGDTVDFIPSKNDAGIYEEATYTARFAPDEATSYTVEFYYENEGVYPDKPDYTSVRTGTTDTSVSVTDLDKQPAREDYVLDPSADNVFSGNIAGDGSLVLKVYFAKDVKGGGEDGKDPDAIPDRYQIIFRYEAEENGTVTGSITEVHTFGNPEDGYTIPTATMPDANVAAAGNPGYHITGWTDESEEDLGTDVKPDFGEHRYVQDQTFTVSFGENDKVTIRYEAEAHGKVSADSETLAPATGIAQGSVATPDPGYHFAGWYLGENQVGNEISFVPSKNAEGIYEEATYIAKFAPDTDTKYQVEFYYTDKNGDYPEQPTEIVNRTGTTDTQVSVTEEDKQPKREGYILDQSAANIFEGTVAGDGSLALKVYFAEDTKGGGEDGEEPDEIPDRYQVVFKYVAEDNGTVTGTLSETHTFGNAEEGYSRPTPITPEAKVAAAANPGYYIAGWTDENKEDLGTGIAPAFGELQYSEDQIFTVSFAEKADVYIKYIAEEHGRVSNDGESLAPATGTAEGSVATPDTGYHFTGWYRNGEQVGEDLKFVPGRNADGIYETATYVARFAPDETTRYTVEFYYENHGEYPEEADLTSIRQGTTDTEVSVTDLDKQPVRPDYVLDPSADNIFSGNVTGDGSLVLKVYFAKDVKGGGEDGEESDDIPDRYQLIFKYEAEENGVVTGNVTEVHTFGNAQEGYTLPSAITPDANVTAKGNPGYHIAGWTDEAKEDLGDDKAPEFEKRTYDSDQIFTVSFAENDDVTIRYEAESHGTVSRNSETVAPATGTAKGSEATPDPGYHFAGWYLEDEEVSQNLNFIPSKNSDGIYEEATYTAKFAPDEQTLYMVEYYYTDKDGNYPEEPTETAKRNGVTDTLASVTDQDKQPTREGYILDETAENIFEGNITGDGSLVLKLYFAKDVKGGGEDGDEPDDIPDRYQVIFKYKAEENGSVTGNLTETHTFKDDNGSYVLPTPITPNGEVTAAPDAGYHIVAWTDESGEDLGSETAPVFGEHQYSQDQTFTVSFAENADVTIKYEAESHGTVSRDSETVAPATGIAEGSVATPDPGYHFNGWYRGDESVGQNLSFVPAKNADGIYEEATYTAKFAPDNNTAYLVEYYYTDQNGDYPEKADEVVKRVGVTDTLAVVTDQDKQPAREGYILDETAENIFEGTISGDGSLVLKLYFAKDVNGGGEKGDQPDSVPDRYQVIFRYIAEDNGQVTGTTAEVHTFKDENGRYILPTPITPKADVKASANAGYHIENWTDESDNALGAGEKPEFGDFQYTENQTFTVSFTENSDVTIYYEAEAHGKVSADSETLAPATGKAEGSEATPDAGYHFDGWYLGETQVSQELIFVPERNADGIYESATYTAKFVPDEDTPYTVEFYYSDKDGSYGKEPAQTLKRTGTTDTQVSVTEADKQPVLTGYVLDETAANIFEGNIAGDGSLVLKVYFTKDTLGGGEDGNGSDGIPDRYQLIFQYVAEGHGSVTGNTVEVRTFKDENGNYVEPSAVIPYASVEAVPEKGYVVDMWSDEDGNTFGSQAAPAIAQTYDRNMTFTVTFKAEDNFAGVTEDKGNKPESGKTDGSKSARGPKTGDDSPIELWLALGVVSLGGVIALGTGKRRKKDSKQSSDQGQ